MKYLIIIFLFFISLSLRTLFLDTRPPGLTWDEAAIGYNAYSLLKTGRDEHGVLSPIVFKSFGDFKPGLYIYFTVPTVYALGLNEFATRLPSAIIGSLLTLVIFVLSAKLFQSFKVGLFSSLVLTFMPWAIHFSRGAWEANLNIFIISLAIALALKKRYLLSSFFIGFTFWTYQSAKLFTPLLVLSWYIAYRTHLTFKKLIMPLIIVVVMVSPLVINFSQESGRLNVYSVFNYPEIGPFDSQFFHPQALHFARGIIERYLNHYSPRFLLTEGDWSNARHSTPYYGNLHLLDAVPLVIGLLLLLKNLKLSRPNLIFISLLLIIGPLPASLSRDIVSGVRSLTLVIPLTLIIAYGLSRLPKLLLPIYFLLLIASLAFHWDLSINHSPYLSADAWLYPYKYALKLVSQNKADYSHIYITDKLGQPYIFTLFYAAIDPKTFQAQNSYRSSGLDVGSVSNFDNYIFGPVDWPNHRGDSSSLFVGDKFELPDQDMNPENLVWIGDVNYPNGLHGLRVVGLK